MVEEDTLTPILTMPNFSVQNILNCPEVTFIEKNGEKGKKERSISSII